MSHLLCFSSLVFSQLVGSYFGLLPDSWGPTISQGFALLLHYLIFKD